MTPAGKAQPNRLPINPPIIAPRKPKLIAPDQGPVLPPPQVVVHCCCSGSVSARRPSTYPIAPPTTAPIDASKTIIQTPLSLLYTRVKVKAVTFVSEQFKT